MQKKTILSHLLQVSLYQLESLQQKHQKQSDHIRSAIYCWL